MLLRLTELLTDVLRRNGVVSNYIFFNGGLRRSAIGSEADKWGLLIVEADKEDYSELSTPLYYRPRKWDSNSRRCYGSRIRGIGIAGRPE